MRPKVNADAKDVAILRLMYEDDYTFQELADQLGFKSKSNVHRRVLFLEKQGLIEREPNKSRRRRLTNHGREHLRQASR